MKLALQVDLVLTARVNALHHEKERDTCKRAREGNAHVGCWLGVTRLAVSSVQTDCVNLFPLEGDDLIYICAYTP